MALLFDTWQRLLWQIAPETCASCAACLDQDALLCAGCLSACQLATRERLLGGVPAWACAEYEGPIAAALRRFKFEDHPELARRLATTLHAHLPWSRLDPSIRLVPVPLHPLKLAARRYNQAALLSSRLASLLGCRHSPRGLVRRLETRQQSMLGRHERLRNLASAFGADPKLDAARVVLVDDVVTTGATAQACFTALRAIGAEVVAVLSVAHTHSSAQAPSSPPPSPSPAPQRPRSR